jgi:hypothetical protein
MSARGARSRIVQLKDVKKKEKKVGKGRAIETSNKPRDGFANWLTTPSVDNPRRGISRSLTASSRATSRSSGTNDSNNQPRQHALYSNNSSDVRAAPLAVLPLSRTFLPQAKTRSNFRQMGKKQRLREEGAVECPSRKLSLRRRHLVFEPSPRLPILLRSIRRGWTSRYGQGVKMGCAHTEGLIL